MSNNATVTPALLASQYEELRAQALGARAGSATGRGLAVLIRRGLTAWLTLCQELLGRADEVCRPLPAPPIPTGARVLHSDATADLVRTLAGMALAAADRRGA